MLQEKLKELALANVELEHWNKKAEDKQFNLEQTVQFQELQIVKGRAEKVKEDIDALRDEINSLTLEAYQQTGDKKPAPGVGVRVYTNYVYDQNEAISYCRQELPAALKLDKRSFEKYVKGVQEVKPLEFVTV